MPRDTVLHAADPQHSDCQDGSSLTQHIPTPKFPVLLSRAQCPESGRPAVVPTRTHARTHSWVGRSQRFSCLETARPDSFRSCAPCPQRCMSNNYSVVGFWKGWHCSFNRWLVRYIFIPLGGSRPGRRWNVFVVFAFVAFWHDVEPKLFMWGMLNGVFLVLEVMVKGLYRSSGRLERCRANPLANRWVVGGCALSL